MVKGVTILCNLYTKTWDERLQNPELIKFFLTNTLLNLGLTPIYDSLVVKVFPVQNSGGFGITGTIILTESHLCCHTWAEYGFCRIELSSCKEISVDKFKEMVKAFFPESQLDVKTIKWR